MVKKHSKLLGKTIVDKEDAADVEMDSHIWRDVMDLYFVLGRESRDRQGDDLVFFLRKLVSTAPFFFFSTHSLTGLCCSRALSHIIYSLHGIFFFIAYNL